MTKKYETNRACSTPDPLQLLNDSSFEAGEPLKSVTGFCLPLQTLVYFFGFAIWVFQVRSCNLLLELVAKAVLLHEIFELGLLRAGCSGSLGKQSGYSSAWSYPRYPGWDGNLRPLYHDGILTFLTFILTIAINYAPFMVLALQPRVFVLDRKIFV